MTTKQLSQIASALAIDDATATGQAQRTWYDGIGYAAVPEPASVAIGALGLGGLLAARRRKLG